MDHTLDQKLKDAMAQERFSPFLAAIILSVHLLAFFGMFYYFNVQALIALAIAHTFFVTFGIALGYHRYLSHVSFVPTKFFGRFLATVSTLCFQGGPIYWAAAHRAHHQRTEKLGDPHSATRGFWWSHCGWMFFSRPNGFSYKNQKRFVADLTADTFLVFLDKNAVYVNLVFAIVLAGAFALIKRLDLFFFIVPVRIVTVWHSTWLINSWYHGARFGSDKRPKGLKNHLLADFILGGEGSHANHHNRPRVLRNSKTWYQLDTSYLLILFFRRVGLVKSYRGEPLTPPKSAAEF